MKRIITYLCLMLVVLALVGCGALHDAVTTDPSATPSFTNPEEFPEYPGDPDEIGNGGAPAYTGQPNNPNLTEPDEPESTNATTENTDATESTTEPATEPTIPPTTEPVTEPPTTESTEKNTESTTPAVIFTEVNETVYANVKVNIRTGPGTAYEKIGQLRYAHEIQRTGIGKNGWSRVIYDGREAYLFSDYVQTEKPYVVSSDSYPLYYSDGSCNITVSREWYENAWCYIAHVTFTDYTRLASSIAHDTRGSFSTTSSEAYRQGAILCVNGPYNWGELATCYAIIRNGIVYNDGGINGDIAIYNAHTGVLARAEQLGLAGMQASTAAAQGLATDTFKFWNSTLVLGGTNMSNADNDSRAQRTFIGTNGNPGDIYIIVSDGRYMDGESAGLTKYECAKLLLDLGCSYGVMLDGGGSSTMVFRGKVLNSAIGNERAVVDFLYFK